MSDPTSPQKAAFRVRACSEPELRVGDAMVVPLTRARSGRPREAVLVRDFDGSPRAYLNECKHLPVPLDGGTRDFLDYTKTALFCGTHGALYDLGTGYCYEGPCVGASLDALEVVLEAGDLYVLDTLAAVP